MTNELAIASAEINEILRYLPEEFVNKIPINLRILLKNMAPKEFKSNVDPTKTLIEQDISDKAKDIIAIFYRNYWCSKEKRLQLDEVLNENEIKYQKILKEKYNSNNMFNNSLETKEKYIEEKPNQLIEIKEDNIFKRILNVVKNILHR